MIDPAGADPVAYDREHVIVLSDWSFLHPHQLIAKLKQEGGYFNRQKQTLAGMLAGGPEEQMSASDRAMWGKMRMDPTDIADITGAAYTYLVNGHGPAENWTGLFAPGERVRLRIINASAMTIFNVRIPGLRNDDGQRRRPGRAPGAGRRVPDLGRRNLRRDRPADRRQAPTPWSPKSIDRSGLTRATLAPRLGMQAPVPPLRPRPTLSMKDMGMGDMDHGAMPGMDHGASAAGGMDHDMRDKSKAPPGMKVGVGVDMIAPMPVDRTGDPGLGLDDVDHKVLTYRDLMALTPNPDPRAPTRTVEVHLTGNMERFMWSFDGEKFSEGTEPIRFERDERVRIVLINDSMMSHPIHLHGHFFEVVNGHTGSHPRKHTVNVLPGGKVSLDLTADAPGDWAFHCHLQFHMHAGMFRVVSVRPLEGEGA